MISSLCSTLMLLCLTERCRTPWMVRSLRCTNDYNLFSQDEATYLPTWLPLPQPDTDASAKNETESSSTVKNPLSSVEEAFAYTSQSDLNGDLYDGLYTTYSGGGYVTNLGESFEEAIAVVQNLSDSAWVDQYTRAIFVEFSMLNPNSKLFNLALILFEYPTDGSTLWSTRMGVGKL